MSGALAPPILVLLFGLEVIIRSPSCRRLYNPNAYTEPTTPKTNMDKTQRAECSKQTTKESLTAIPVTFGQSPMQLLLQYPLSWLHSANQGV